MKRILAISGSGRPDSTNLRLLKLMKDLDHGHQVLLYEQINALPIFLPHLSIDTKPPGVIAWEDAIEQADGLIICTPEYIYNIPALIKNALEWVTASGVLSGKKVLPITLTPHPPRGEKAMQSLLWSLSALEAQVLPSLSLYVSEIYQEKSNRVDIEYKDMIVEALSYF